MATAGRSLRFLTALRHFICVLALMWTGIVNGQPFFFWSDTTNYVRAADAAVYVVSGGRFSTAWTERYRNQVSQPAQTERGRQSKPQPEATSRTSANDLGKGLIMGGRSPYIGALMYIGYLTGDFWPFVLFQALVAYGLIILTLRRFAVASPAAVTGTTLALAATTSLPTYNSLLLADAFASFGILAFLLLATPGKLTRWEKIFLGLVIVISVTAHLTHIMMLIGMTAILGLMTLIRIVPKPPSRAWIAGVGGVLVGLLSVQLTAEATKLAFGREPQLLPLLTARFIADGPGKRFIDDGCDGKKFDICTITIGEPRSDALILFGNTPQNGAYMLADAEQRLRMGQQDIPFALAVLKYDPNGELSAMAKNTVRQLLWIDYDGLNQNCFGNSKCWASLPSGIRAKLRSTPSGRGEWPQAVMNDILYAVVVLALIGLAFMLPAIARHDPPRWRLIREWLIIGFAGMLVCAFFGGAVADPQYRYQGRLIWLVPLMAILAFLVRRQISATPKNYDAELVPSGQFT
jgi:hypothetical protein